MIPRNSRAEEMADPEPHGKRGRSWLVLLFSLTTVAITLACISVFYVGFAIVLGCLVGFVAFHYFAWGWWLGPLLAAEAEEEEGPP